MLGKPVLSKSKKASSKRGSCLFCSENKEPDYKDYQLLLNFLTDRARIVPACRSEVCAKHQRRLGREIKKARFLALLPYVEKIS